MLATISPAYDNYEETISTLRYADQAKKIVNHAVINEDEPGTIIRDLRNEIDKLRKELADAKVSGEGRDWRKIDVFVLGGEISGEAQCWNQREWETDENNYQRLARTNRGNG